ncbi:MAG: GlxA family transcriptional regulator [Solirubrobacteraceae bacterium]
MEKKSATRRRQIVILAFAGVQSLDVTGPLEVFAGAQDLIESTGRSDSGFDVQIVSRDGAPLATSSGMTIVPHGSIADVTAAIDTLIVPGGSGQSLAGEDHVLLDWIARASAGARRTASVCTGAFLLARAGLLDGRRASTHWAHAAKLSRQYPNVDVDPDPIFVRDGNIWSSAGVTAGMDLALALVEEDLDRDAALTLARHLVLFLRRPGSQSQFSVTLGSQQPQRESLRDIQSTVLEDVAGVHTVEAMAERAHMSPRHFARAFRLETGITPARYVERVRLEAARRHLEEGSESIAQVARACGFGTPETMRRVFLRALHVGPAEYRRRFQGSTPSHKAA